MLKSRRFKRKAVCLGLTATLIAGFAVTFVVPTAANICRELNMAGFYYKFIGFTAGTDSDGGFRICNTGGNHRGNGGAGQEESTEEE